MNQLIFVFYQKLQIYANTFLYLPITCWSMSEYGF